MALVCFSGVVLRCYLMDNLTKRWKKLSLSKVEGNKEDLSKKKKSGEHVVAAKFLTRRNINVEVVARMFRPLWRT